jgi:hypothetical protein
MTNETPQPPDEQVEAPPPPVEPGRSTGFGVVALVLGGLGGVIPFLPADLGDARAWLPLPFALLGLAVGIFGTSGPRRGNAWATVGAVVCTIAVGLSTVMLIAAPRDGKDTAGPGHTEEILRDELDVRLGERRTDPETGFVYLTVTLYNKGPYTASYTARFEVNAEEPCDESVTGHHLAPGASHQEEVGTCSRQVDMAEVTYTVVEAVKDPYS